MDEQEDHRKGKSAYRPIVPAVEQASRILLCLGEGPHFKMRLADICRQVGIYKSKGFSILNTFNQFGLVEKDPQTKTYFLGPSLLFLSRNVLNNMNYPEVVAPFLESLSKHTRETVAFGLIRGSHIFVIARREGNIGLGVGQRFHLTLGAHGKAIAAFMDEGEREKLLIKKRLYFYGDPSRMDRERFREEIIRCRDLGFAWDVGEVTPGVNIVSAPVLGPHERIVGCILLVGTFPKTRITEFGPEVARVARLVSYKLGAHVK